MNCHIACQLPKNIAYGGGCHQGKDAK